MTTRIQNPRNSIEILVSSTSCPQELVEEMRKQNEIGASHGVCNRK